MKSWLLRYWRALLGAIVVVGIAIAGLSYAYWDQTVKIGSMTINYMRYWSAPAGTLETEVAQTGTTAQSPTSTASALPQIALNGTAGDWPSYNKTLTSNRFSELSQINRTNAEKLKVLCTYDTGAYTGFNSGLLQVGGALIFVTAFDIFSIDAATCRENWRTHEDYVPATPQEVNRGAAYPRRHAFSWHPRRPCPRIRFQDGQTHLGNHDREPEEGRDCARAPSGHAAAAPPSSVMNSRRFIHSMTSLARASKLGGISRPRAFAVVRLMTRSNLVGCSTGRSAG